MTFARNKAESTERAAEREAQKARNRSVNVNAHRNIGRYGGEVRPAAAQPKPQPVRNADWLAAVRSIESCVLCGRNGTQAAHRNWGKGLGTKADDCACAALCPECHRDIDQGAGMTREQRRSEMDRAIVLTLIALVSAGRVGVK